MTSLPDGEDITQQFVESWDVSPISGVSKRYTEAWETKLLQIAQFDLSLSETIMKVGDALSISGTSKRGDGLPADATINIERPDGTTDTISAGVESDGSYVEQYTASVSGQHAVQATNDLADLRHTEGWDA